MQTEPTRVETKRIFLVRHGESEANVDTTLYQRVPDFKIELTAKGRQQAEETGKFLSESLRQCFYGDVLVWSSPHTRAVATAGLIRKELGERVAGNIRTSVLLAEQQLGTYDGLNEDQRKKQAPKWWKHHELHAQHKGEYWVRPPGGESRFDVCVRVQQFFSALKESPQHNHVVVAHGTTMRAFRCMWMGYDWQWMEQEKSPVNGAVLAIEWVKDLSTSFDRGCIWPENGSSNSRKAAPTKEIVDAECLADLGHEVRSLLATSVKMSERPSTRRALYAILAPHVGVSAHELGLFFDGVERRRR